MNVNNVNYLEIPKDIRQIEKTYVFNLTKRQLICLGGAVVFGFIFYFIFFSLTGNTMVGVLSMMVAVAPFLICLKKINEQYLEQYIFKMIKFIRCEKIKKYQSENVFADLNRQIEYNRLIKLVDYKEEPIEVIKKKTDKIVKAVKKVAKRKE